MKDFLIKCEDLSIGYNNVAIHSHINLDINKSEYICILGQNGAGKTTLFRTILGLIPSLSGNIKRSVKNIGYVPQQNNTNQNFPASVWEIVLSGMVKETPFFYKKAQKEKAKKVMQYFNIDELKDNCFLELSGGQQQRVMLARAICCSSDLLVLDEPTNGLDKVTKKMLYSELKKLHKNGTTILMITHDEIPDETTHIIRVSQDGNITKTKVR